MNSYLLFKSLHLIAVISWMAGLLYLPRIFVYHVENIDHKISSSIFKTMERKLFYLHHDASDDFILDFWFNINLMLNGFEVISQLWLKLKIILITFVTIYHFYLGKLLE